MKIILNEFVALCANGSRAFQTAGCALMAGIPNISTELVTRVGIRLRRAEDVRDAIINGVGPRVFVVTAFLFTKIGIRRAIDLLS